MGHPQQGKLYAGREDALLANFTPPLFAHSILWRFHIQRSNQLIQRHIFKITQRVDRSLVDQCIRACQHVEQGSYNPLVRKLSQRMYYSRLQRLFGMGRRGVAQQSYERRYRPRIAYALEHAHQQVRASRYYRRERLNYGRDGRLSNSAQYLLGSRSNKLTSAMQHAINQAGNTLRDRKSTRLNSSHT